MASSIRADGGIATSTALDAVLTLPRPYLLFIGDIEDPLVAKTAFGLRDWSPRDVTGQWRLAGTAVDLGLPELTPQMAKAAGARALVIGAAPSGGRLPPHWCDALHEAIGAGLDIVSGLHSNLADIPGLAAAAQAAGLHLLDVRTAPATLPIGSGARRAGKRLLTVGSDCAIGKKYTALALAREMSTRGFDVTFRATGQTGILIAGGGLAIDTVVSDFLSGAAELISPAAAPDHWDVIEGQGSLFHPSYAGVALGLLHGAQPDAIVLCADATRREIDGCPGFPLPSVAEAIRRNIEAAQLTNREVRCAGIAMNTAALGEAEAAALLARLADDHQLPCVDPMRTGVGDIVDLLERGRW